MEQRHHRLHGVYRVFFLIASFGLGTEMCNVMSLFCGGFSRGGEKKGKIIKNNCEPQKKNGRKEKAAVAIRREEVKYVQYTLILCGLVLRLVASCMFLVVDDEYKLSDTFFRFLFLSWLVNNNLVIINNSNLDPKCFLLDPADV